jgi:hypothetical protein
MANARQPFLFSEMKQKTRDNLIYLAVGLGVVALIVADSVYADSHGQRMWWPSRFASRATYTTALLAYFVARETRKAKATLAQVLACTLFASIVHLGIVFTFHRAVGELSGISFSALAVFEMFLVFQLMMAVVRYLRSG